MAEEEFQITARRYPSTGYGFISGHEMVTALDRLHADNENIGGSVVLDPSAGGWQLKIQSAGSSQQVAGIGDCVVFFGGTVETMTLETFDARYGGGS